MFEPGDADGESRGRNKKLKKRTANSGGAEATQPNQSPGIAEAIRTAVKEVVTEMRSEAKDTKKYIDQAQKQVEEERKAMAEIVEKSMKGLPDLWKDAHGDDESGKAIASMQAGMVKMSENLVLMRGTVSENLILPTKERVLLEIRVKERREPTPEENSAEYYAKHVRDWFDKNLRTLEASQESFEEWGLVYQQLVSDVNQLEGNKDTNALGRDLRQDLEKRKNFRRFIRIAEVSPFDQTVASSNLLNNDVWERIMTMETKNYKEEGEKMVAKEFRQLCFMGEDIKAEMEHLKRLKYRQGVLLKLKKQDEAFEKGREIAATQKRLQTLRSELFNYVNRGGRAVDTEGKPILDGKKEQVFTKDEIEVYGDRSLALISQREKLENSLNRYNFLAEKMKDAEGLNADEKIELKELENKYKDTGLKKGEADPGVKGVIEKTLTDVDSQIAKLSKLTQKLKDDQWSRLMAGRLFSASLMTGELNIPDLCGGIDFFVSRPENFGDEWAETRGLLYLKNKAYWDPLPRQVGYKKQNGWTKEEWQKNTLGMETYEEWIQRTGGEQFGGRLTFKAPNFFQRMIKDEMKIQRVIKSNKELNKMQNDGKERNYSEIGKDIFENVVPTEWIDKVALHADVLGEVKDVGGSVFLVDDNPDYFIKDPLVLDDLKEGFNKTDDGQLFWVETDSYGKRYARKMREPRESDYDWGSEKVWKAIRTREDGDNLKLMLEDPHFGVAENISSRDMYDEISSAVDMLKMVYWGNQSALHNFTLEKLLESAKFGKNVGEWGRQKLWKNYLDRALWMMEDESRENVRGIFRERANTLTLEKLRFVSTFSDKDLITDEMENKEYSDHISGRILWLDERRASEFLAEMNIALVGLFGEDFRLKTAFDAFWNALKILFGQTFGDELGATRR